MNILKQNERIELVPSDVVMPGGITGFDVAAKALDLRTDMKILLATGYAKAVLHARTARPDHTRGQDPVLRRKSQAPAESVNTAISANGKV